MSPEGHAIGTLCVMDQTPRELTGRQRVSLRALARQVMAQLELRRHFLSLERRVERSARFQEALRTLVRLKHDDFDAELRRIAQMDAETLDVTRAELLRLYGGEGDAGFREFLAENFYDLHYATLPGAQPFSFGLGNLWRIAIEYLGCPVPPCIHRAPLTLPGMPVRLLLIS